MDCEPNLNHLRFTYLSTETWCVRMGKVAPA